MEKKIFFLSTPSGLRNSSLLLDQIMCSAIEFLSLIKELLWFTILLLQKLPGGPAALQVEI